MKKLYALVITYELTIPILIAALVAVIIVALDYHYGISWPDVQVEAHGLMMDLFVFGVLILTFNKFKDRSNLKRHYHEEIEDYRDWKSDESKYRILGNIKRLARLGEQKFDLNRCNLDGVHLKDLVVRDSDLSCVNFNNAHISDCIFDNVNFQGAHLTNTIIKCSSFTNCKINSANYFESILYKVNFDKSDLTRFDESNNLHRARVIYEPTNLDVQLYQKIADEKPELLEKPSFEKMNNWTDKIKKF